MSSQIKDSTKSKIDALTWMDEATKALAKAKVNIRKCTVNSMPEFLISDRSMMQLLPIAPVNGHHSYFIPLNKMLRPLEGDGS